MTIQSEMNATLLASLQSRCRCINVHAIVSYWGKSQGTDVGYHLSIVDRSFREMAAALGYRVEEIGAEADDVPSELFLHVAAVAKADRDRYAGEVPALAASITSRYEPLLENADAL